MSSDTSNALNAIGTLIGYIGTEVATDDFFDRLLWPRRAYNGFTWKHVPQAALLMPMGGPIHKAALTTLDGFYRHGLYERYQNGHMLGTTFFSDLKLRYRVFDETPGFSDEHVRNGLPVRAVMRMRPPILTVKGQGKEGGDVPVTTPKVRQQICVGHLKLSRMPPQEKITRTITIHDDASPPRVWTYLALIATELSAIIVAILVGVLWKSAFAALWLIPLVLKLLSTAISVRRETLSVPDPPEITDEKGNAVEEKVKLFGVRNPAGGFVVIESTDSLVLQFFRHYGHPKRSKLLEKLQIAIVVAFTLVFPMGLVSSTLWMSDALQRMWVGYQLYATLAMYVYRYAGGHLWCTTEEQIGKALFDIECEGTSDETLVVLKARSGDAIGMQLVRTSHRRFGEALAHVEQMINTHQHALLSRVGMMPMERTSSDMSSDQNGANGNSGKTTNPNTHGWE
jgi:hypothetical protein